MSQIPINNAETKPSTSAKIPYETIVKYFRYPLDDASKKLNIDKNELIECCRIQGIKRWPYRRGMKSVNIGSKSGPESDQAKNFTEFKSLVHKKLIKGDTVTVVEEATVKIEHPKIVKAIRANFQPIEAKTSPIKIEKQTKTIDKMSIRNILN